MLHINIIIQIVYILTDNKDHTDHIHTYRSCIRQYRHTSHTVQCFNSIRYKTLTSHKHTHIQEAWNGLSAVAKCNRSAIPGGARLSERREGDVKSGQDQLAEGSGEEITSIRALFSSRWVCFECLFVALVSFVTWCYFCLCCVLICVSICVVFLSLLRFSLCLYLYCISVSMRVFICVSHVSLFLSQSCP